MQRKNMYTRLRAASFLAFLLFSVTGIAQSVSSDYDGQVDFSRFKTYAWLAPGDSVLNRPSPAKLFGGYVEKAANEELRAKGLKLVKENPDAIFIFFTNAEEVIHYSQSATLSVGVGVAGPGYYVGGSTPVAGGKITSKIEEDGTLSFSMYDTQTKKLVWKGTVQKTFKPSDDIPKLITDNTKKIFKKLPVKKQK